MANSEAETTEQTDMSHLAGKYLTFKLGEEDYALQILKVQEIIEMQEITRVPRTPEYVKGVINLRGKVLPVIDLRLKFGLEEQEATRHTCIILVYVQSGDRTITMGLIIDEVSEVLDITSDQLEPPPSFGTQLDTTFILGMAKTDDSVKILLAIDSIFSEQEKTALESASS